MTKKTKGSLLLALCISTTALAQTHPQSNLHIGLAYPISSNGGNAAEYTNGVSLHAISGLSYSEKAFCASGVASIIRDSARGFVGSGMVSIIGNKATGMQASGFMNYTAHQVKGMQAAGFINMAGDVTGVQAAGFANIVTNDVTGVQAAGFINVAKTATSQAAGFINLSDTNKSQVAGFINIANYTQGAQVAGFANVANNVEGTQVAGFINIAHKVKGAQISGFINIADSCDYPIGLINLIKKGEKAFGIMTDLKGTTFVTFRSGGRVLYGIVGAGFNGTRFRSIYASQAGLGTHFRISRMVRINGEATTTSYTDFRRNTEMESAIKLLPSVRMWNWELFAGPSFNYSVAYGTSTAFDHNNVWATSRYGYRHELFIGMQCGIQYHF